MPQHLPAQGKNFFISHNSKSSNDKSRTPTYLAMKRGIYYFRYVLPMSLKVAWKRSELRISLQTAYLRIARYRARLLHAEVERHLLEGMMLEYREIRRRMNILLQRMLEQEHANLKKRDGIKIGDINIPYVDMCEAHADLQLSWNYEEMLSRLAPHVKISLLMAGAFSKEELVGENSLQIVKAYNEMQNTFNRIMAARERGDFLLEEEIISKDFGYLPYENHQEKEKIVEIIDSIDKRTSANDGLLYSQVMEEYIIQNLKDGKWRENNVVDHRSRINEFLEIIGDKCIHEITREDIRNFRDILRQLPPNRTRSKDFRGKSIQEIIAMNPAKTLNVKTVNIIVEAVSSMLRWCVREGKLQNNVATHLQLKDDRQDIDLRDAFSKEELIKIFSHPKFSKKEFKFPSYYWIPIIALYTGMRLEEIAQLHCTDIYKSSTEEFYIFNVNDKGVDEYGNKKILKNKNARRLIPVHNSLIKLGLLEYREKILNQNHIRLFPDLKKTEKTTKFGKQPGKQFKSVITATLGNVQGKTFHSLRHTFSDFYKQRNLQNDPFRQVFGHELPTLAARQYGEKFSPELLYRDVISKLDYSFIDDILIKN